MPDNKNFIFIELNALYSIIYISLLKICLFEGHKSGNGDELMLFELRETYFNLPFLLAKDGWEIEKIVFPCTFHLKFSAYEGKMSMFRQLAPLLVVCLLCSIFGTKMDQVVEWNLTFPTVQMKLKYHSYRICWSICSLKLDH